MSDRDKTIRDALRTQLGVGDVAKPKTPDLIGEIVLDRYLVEAKLGAGAMGTVFRGSDIKTHQGVAIKALHRHLVHDQTMLGRFRREATAAARLRHENVAGVIDVGEHANTQLIVLELANGPSLRSIMTGPLPAARIVSLVAGILRGLDHAHAAKLIHRDLKPDNVIVDTASDGADIPRIVDFGIAVLRDPEDTIGGARLTASGVVIGTPLYMAPEQAKGEAFDHRIDLFALGVIVYEMASGVTPFTGSVHEVALSNIGKDPPPIAQRAPGVAVDPLLEAFARKLMARRLTDRFSTAQRALDVLDLIARDPEAAALALGRMDVAKAIAMVGLGGGDPDEP
jgi:serine/threonine-protein kinase